MPTRKLMEDIKQLIEDTDDYDEALIYIEQLAFDCEVTVDEAVAELKRQFKKLEE